MHKKIGRYDPSFPLFSPADDVVRVDGRNPDEVEIIPPDCQALELWYSESYCYGVSLALPIAKLQTLRNVRSLLLMGDNNLAGVGSGFLSNLWELWVVQGAEPDAASVGAMLRLRMLHIQGGEIGCLSDHLIHALMNLGELEILTTPPLPVLPAFWDWCARSATPDPLTKLRSIAIDAQDLGRESLLEISRQIPRLFPNVRELRIGIYEPSAVSVPLSVEDLVYAMTVLRDGYAQRGDRCALVLALGEISLTNPPEDFLKALEDDPDADDGRQWCEQTLRGVTDVITGMNTGLELVHCSPLSLKATLRDNQPYYYKEGNVWAPLLLEHELGPSIA